MSEPEAVKMMFACGPGICDMDVSRDIAGDGGVRIFAGGAEGMLKMFDPKDLDNPVSELNLDVEDSGDEGLAVTALAVSPAGDELALGLRNGDVKLFELPSLELKSILTRFTAPVLGLHYGMENGGVIEEPGIKIVRTSDNSRVLTLDDHDGGVKSVAWDPQGQYLAAAGFDGTVKIWNVDPTLDDLLTELVSTSNYFPKEAVGGGDSEDGFAHLGKVAWHPEGSSLSITGSPDPLMLERGTWERSMIVPEDAEEGGHVKDITVCSFSPDGLHMATAALDGRVVVWDMKEKQALKMFVNTEQENWRHLEWLDGSNLAALSTGGSVCILEGVPVVTTEALSGLGKTDDGKRMQEGGASGKEGPPKDLFDEEAAEDNGNVSEADTAPIEDGIGDDVAAGDVTAGLDDSVVGGGGDGGGDGGGEGVDDHGGHIGADGDMLDMIPPVPYEPIQPHVARTPLQDPFQPSSTPLGDARRYMCWNRVGTIISIDENTHNAVEIEFADKSAGRNQRFMDTWNFVMGSLSLTGAVFASVAQEEDETSLEPSPSGGRSVLYYKALGKRSQGEDWTRMMPKGESILSVAVGREWAAVATDRQLVRVFTASGLQGDTVMLPGPVVSAVGGGDLLAVFFHKGEPIGDTQSLGYQLLDVAGKREIAKGDVCMSPATELTWLGMSEERMLVAMDSSGLLSALTQSYGWQWTPLLDTLKVSKNKKDRFWPVGVVTGKLLAATLKGGEEHPAAYPRPVLTTLPLSTLNTKSQDGEEMAKFEKVFPAMQARVRQRKFNLDQGLAEDEGDTEEMEGELMSQQVQLDTMIVKRIQEACAGEKAERAMDLASLLNLEKTFGIAIKVANHHGLTSLAAGIEEAMISKFRRPEDDMDDEEDVEALQDNGCMRGGGGSGGSGGARGGQRDEENEEENLGPLDRARLRARRAKDESAVVSPPPRVAAPTASSVSGKRYANEYDDDVQALETPLGIESDIGGEAEIIHSDEDSAAFSEEAHKQSRRRKLGQDEEGQEGHDDQEDQEEEVMGEEGLEAAALPPPAPRNPFARGATFSSPPRKKRKDVLETMNDLQNSPSPVSKRPALTRLSSFAAEARTKNRNDRNVL